MNGRCVNTQGGYECQCNDGYHGNGFICEGQCIALHIVATAAAVISYCDIILYTMITQPMSTQ